MPEKRRTVGRTIHFLPMRVFLTIILCVFLLVPLQVWADQPLSPDEIKSLLSDLQSPDPQIKGQAALTLLKSSETLNPLSTRLAVSAAVKAIRGGFMGNPTPFLIAILTSSSLDPTTRAEAALGLGLDASAARQRADTAKRSGTDQAKDEREFASEDVIHALEDGLKSVNDPRVRLASASALGDLRDWKGKDALKSILDNPQEDLFVRVAAGRSLVEIVALGRSPGKSEHDPPEYVTKEMMEAALLYGALRYGTLVSPPAR